jgi:hypothetical protein
VKRNVSTHGPGCLRASGSLEALLHAGSTRVLRCESMVRLCAYLRMGWRMRTLDAWQRTSEYPRGSPRPVSVHDLTRLANPHRDCLDPNKTRVLL